MIRPLAVLALSTLALSASAQDLTITFKASDGTASTSYFTKDKVRTASGRSDAIMDFASGTIVNIDHQKKEYFEMTVTEIDEVSKAASAQMEQAMAQVPPQMREQMAKMMGGAAAEVTVTKGATRTIAGYACQDYTIAMGANMTQETCNSTALTPPFDPANFIKMARISVPMIQGMDKFVARMQEIKGIALATHMSMNVMGQKRETTMEATEVKKGPVAADAFQIPAGYKKVESPLKSMGKMGGRR